MAMHLQHQRRNSSPGCIKNEAKAEPKPKDDARHQDEDNAEHPQDAKAKPKTETKSGQVGLLLWIKYVQVFQDKGQP